MKNDIVCLIIIATGKDDDIMTCENKRNDESVLTKFSRCVVEMNSFAAMVIAGVLVLGSMNQAHAQKQYQGGLVNLLDGSYIGVNGGYSFSDLALHYNGTRYGRLRDSGAFLSVSLGTASVIEESYYLGLEILAGTSAAASSTAGKKISPTDTRDVSIALDHEYSVAAYLKGGFFVENDALLYMIFGWSRSGYDINTITQDTGSAPVYHKIDIFMDGFAWGLGFEYPVLENFNARMQYRLTSYWEGQTYAITGGADVGTTADQSNEHHFTFGIGYQF